MNRFMVVAACAIGLGVSVPLSAQRATVVSHGRAIVEFSSPQVKAVAAYEYSQREHAGSWLLVELAVLAKDRIAIHRDQISLVTPAEVRIPVATQQQFLEDRPDITRLLQNATVTRRPLHSYFRTALQDTIQFYTYGGSVVHDSFVTNLDEAASGDVLFKSPDGTWPAGTYRLEITHDKAKAALPLTLK